MKKESTFEICCGLLVLLFLYAGFSKLIPFTEFTRFQHDMHNQPFPRWFADIIIWTLPAVEIGIAITLIVNKWRGIGLAASLILMTLFTLYTSVALLHLFPYTPCSCGGIIKRLTWPQHFVFNLIYTGIAVLGIAFNQKIKKREYNPALA